MDIQKDIRDHTLRVTRAKPAPKREAYFAFRFAERSFFASWIWKRSKSVVEARSLRADRFFAWLVTSHFACTPSDSQSFLSTLPHSRREGKHSAPREKNAMRDACAEATC